MNNPKAFGIWMDNHHAIVVRRKTADVDTLSVLGHIKREEGTQNSSEKNSNNSEKTIQGIFFKEIAALLTNATCKLPRIRSFESY